MLPHWKQHLPLQLHVLVVVAALHTLFAEDRIAGDNNYYLNPEPVIRANTIQHKHQYM